MNELDIMIQHMRNAEKKKRRFDLVKNVVMVLVGFSVCYLFSLLGVD